jgi:protein phosphatase 1G
LDKEIQPNETTRSAGKRKSKHDPDDDVYPVTAKLLKIERPDGTERVPEEDAEERGVGISSGTTATVALLKGNQIVVANAGDSRCILCRNGKSLELSFDHKPEDDIETKRVVKAGGVVDEDGRVNGGLNLSRAIGDHQYKRNTSLPAEAQMISAEPDLISETLTEQDEFLVLACDGIWNSLESEEVVQFVRSRLQAGLAPSVVCEQLCDACMAPSMEGDGTGCDNETAMIVLLAGVPKGFNSKTGLALDTRSGVSSVQDGEWSKTTKL